MIIVDQKLTGIPWQEHILKPRDYIPETNETTTVAMDVTEGATTTEDAAAALKVARAEDSMARYEQYKEGLFVTKFLPPRLGALPVAVVILLSVFGFLIFKTEACLCSIWCNPFGAKEAVE